MSLALSEHLPLIASAPDGIQKLRGLILELAVRGKLLPQEPSDEPATKLLERIEQEQKVLAKAGAYKKSKSILQPATEGQPFDLPKSWAWTNFANVTSYIQRGKGPSYADKSDYVVVSQKCVRWNGLDLSQARCITPESFSKYDAIRLLRCGDVLWNSTGTGTIGRAVIVPNLSEDQLLVADSHVTVVRPIIISPDYLWRWIQTPTVQNTIESMASGSTNQIELATSTVTAHPIPIPPLAEQHRIVAKVDELMALCDRLESEQNDSAAAHTVLVETLLGTLTQSTDAADFEANWQRVAEHFDTLFYTEASIHALKQTILQLAVMGRLVAQDPNDEPASELPLKIEPAKAQLLSTRRVKLRNEVENPEVRSLCFSIPESWKWMRFPEAVFFQEGPGIRNWQFTPQGVKLLNVSNILFTDNLDLTNSEKYVSETEFNEKYRHFQIENGDLLFAGSGASWGKVAWFCDPGYPVMLNTSTMRLRFFHESFAPQYLFHFLKSSLFKRQLTIQLAGLQPNFGSTHLGRAYIPIPPLAEQHRIVSKIDELMALCDNLKKQLAESRQQESRLADTLIQTSLKAA